MTKARDLANAADVLDDVSATELSYVNGVTSAIQTQLNAKQAVVSGVDDTEIGYLNGVTSAIQTQIDSKIGSASAISPTLIDAKGDLIVGSAADTAARLAVGANDYVLTADSSATNGVKWAAAASGGGQTLIEEKTASGNSSLSFSSIPGTYKHLLLTFHGIHCSTTDTALQVRLNADSGTNYANVGIYTESGSTPGPLASTGDTRIAWDSFMGNQVDSSNVAYAAQGYLIIYNYASTSAYKYWRGFATHYSSNNSRWNIIDSNGTYKSTSAITSIDISRALGSATFSSASNTSLRLYGVS